jgi:hypothetical protein
MSGHRPWHFLILVLILSAFACNLSTAPADDATSEPVGAAPLVLLLAPVSDSVYTSGTEVQFRALAEDQPVGVAYIEFRVDGFPAGRVDADQGSQPYLEAQVSWVAEGSTKRMVTAEAYRPDGSSLGQSETVIEVIAGNSQTQSLVTLLTPASGSVYAEGTEVKFHVVAQAPQGGVKRVEFRVDNVPVAEYQSDQPEGQPVLDTMALWAAAGQQAHLVTAEAFRPDGTSLGQSEMVFEVVANPFAPPATPNAPADTADDAPQDPPAAVASDGPTVRINTDAGLNVRQGPGTGYESIGSLPNGEQVVVLGRSAALDDANNWWAIDYDGQQGWVLASLTVPEGDVSQVPLVEAP